MNYNNEVIINKENSNIDGMKGKVIYLSDPTKYKVELECGLRVWVPKDSVTPQ